MAQYRTGTISITNGSTAVVGTNTLWSGLNHVTGMILKVQGDPAIYHINEITDDTNIVLDTEFEGTTNATAYYLIVTDYTANHSWPIIRSGDINWTGLLSYSIHKMDSAIWNGSVKFLRFEPQSEDDMPEAAGVFYFDEDEEAFRYHNGTSFYTLATE